MAPAAPSMCPVMDLVELTKASLAFSSPRAFLMAMVSMASFIGVPVPWALTYTSVFGGIACFGHGIGHGFCAAPCLRVRSGDVIGVAGSPVPADLAVYPGAAAYCVLVFFQDESHGAFADDESAPAAVKGQGSCIWII